MKSRNCESIFDKLHTVLLTLVLRSAISHILVYVFFIYLIVLQLMVNKNFHIYIIRPVRAVAKRSLS